MSAMCISAKNGMLVLYMLHATRITSTFNTSIPGCNGCQERNHCSRALQPNNKHLSNRLGLFWTTHQESFQQWKTKHDLFLSQKVQCQHLFRRLGWFLSAGVWWGHPPPRLFVLIRVGGGWGVTLTSGWLNQPNEEFSQHDIFSHTLPILNVHPHQRTECKASLWRFLPLHLWRGRMRYFKRLQLCWAITGEVNLYCIFWCGLWYQINQHQELDLVTAAIKTTKPVNS